jgi:GDP-mannose 4,6-dehydratase
MRALITGVTGQDGSYLAEFLLDKGYEVYGLVRRSSSEKFDRIQLCRDRIELVEGDLTDQSSLDHLIQAIQPDEVYNLAAQSFVPVSWNQPVLTGDVTGLGVVRVLEAIRKHQPRAKFLQASSSEMFGKVTETPQSEPRGSIHAAPTARRKFLAITLRSTTGKATSSLRVRPLVSITNPLVADWILSRARSLTRSLE